MDLIFSEECLNYKAKGHPESPERIKTAYEYLSKTFNYTIHSPEPAKERDLLHVHDSRLVEIIKSGRFYDPDSPNYENIYYYAALSAGGAIMAQEKQGFSLMRPPGHHAGKSFLGGFCYFNNLAVAVKKSGLKTLIVDFDAHHGNGTEDIFHGDDQVVFISLHRSGVFPGSGHYSSLNILNFPLEGYCGDKKYIKTLSEALDYVSDKNFEQLAVSAGFDGHEKDPLASLGLTTLAYEKIGSILARLNLPTFAVLEGGYIGKDLGKNIQSFIRGFKSGKMQQR